MLTAIIVMYRVTESIVRCAVVTSTVRIYLDELIKNMKTNCKCETCVSWLHSLLFLDDTSRTNIQRELRIFAMSMFEN